MEEPEGLDSRIVVRPLAVMIKGGRLVFMILFRIATTVLGPN